MSLEDIEWQNAEETLFKRRLKLKAKQGDKPTLIEQPMTNIYLIILSFLPTLIQL
jgi:hypothetical protein